MTPCRYCNSSDIDADWDNTAPERMYLIYCKSCLVNDVSVLIHVEKETNITRVENELKQLWNTLNDMKNL